MRVLAREDRGLPGHNLGPVAQDQRLRQAVVSMTIALLLTVVLVDLEVARVWRLALFIPFFWVAGQSFQGLYRTCPFHVRCRTRVNAAGEVEPVCSEAELKQARSLGIRVIQSSLLSAIAATALIFFLP